MNEPKKAEIEAAVRRKWPRVVAIHINQRKHRLAVMFGLAPHPDDFTLTGKSHRDLLSYVEAQPATAAA